MYVHVAYLDFKEHILSKWDWGNLKPIFFYFDPDLTHTSRYKLMKHISQWYVACFRFSDQCFAFKDNSIQFKDRNKNIMNSKYWKELFFL
jgi:hypothetical protein